MKPNRSASSFINLVGTILFLGGFSLWAYGIFLACQFLHIPWAACFYVLVAVAVVSASIVFGNRRKKRAAAERVEVQEQRDEAAVEDDEQAVLRRLHSNPPFPLSR